MATQEESFSVVWDKVLTDLAASEDSSPRLLAFLRQATPVALAQGIAILAVSNDSQREFLETRGREEITAALGRAVLDGLERAGICGTIKHMPGHGRSLVDTHKELPTVTASDADLEWDLAPFKALADAPMAMTGHLVFTAWDADHPATQSPYVIERIIRQRIGFSGLLLTDDLDMEALSGTVPERAEVAIAAGCDLALNCWGRMDDMTGIASRVPVMGPATAVRLERALAITRVDGAAGQQAELLAKRDALLGLLA